MEYIRVILLVSIGAAMLYLILRNNGKHTTRK